MFAVDAIESRVVGVTQPRGVLRNDIQHRLDIRRRAGDDAQDFDSSQFAVPSDSLSSWNSRTFSMAITAWSAKVSSSLICLSVKGRTSVRRIMIAPMEYAFTQQRRGKYRA